MEREVLELDVVIVGGGSAGLSCAIHLVDLVGKHNDDVNSGKIEGETIDIEDRIGVFEKGSYIGAHSFSGAILDPVYLNELIPDYMDRNVPFASEVVDEKTLYLTKKKKYSLPYTPKEMHNKGCYILSLSKFNKWLGEIAEEKGVMLFPEIAAAETIYENERVRGIVTDDKGLKPDGSSEMQGMEVKGNVTVFAEGVRGTLTRQLIDKLGLGKDKIETTYELGVKEVYTFEEPKLKKGMVYHIAGYPLKKGTTGGGFIYNFDEKTLAVGMFTGLNSKDPYLDAHRSLQALKLHPFVKELLEGGKIEYYGGKDVVSSGLYSVPQLYCDGGLIIGEAANMLNMARLKGVHLAIKSGMLSAETIFHALKNKDFSTHILSRYEDSFIHSSAYKELYRSRNWGQALAKGFPFKAPFYIGFGVMTGGAAPFGKLTTSKDALETENVKDFYGKIKEPPEKVKSEGELIVDKLKDVYMTQTLHDEHRPSHLKILDTTKCSECWDLYRSPCNYFCPAEVYEMVEVENDEGEQKTVDRELQVNFSNCIHCKSCDIKCPYENILWTLPEGGEGPKYTVV